MGKQVRSREWPQKLAFRRYCTSCKRGVLRHEKIPGISIFRDLLSRAEKAIIAEELNLLLDRVIPCNEHYFILLGSSSCLNKMLRARINKPKRNKENEEEEGSEAVRVEPHQPRTGLSTRLPERRAAYRLIVLYDPPEPVSAHVEYTSRICQSKYPANPALSIVFCHGLTGSWHHTWLDLVTQKP